MDVDVTGINFVSITRSLSLFFPHLCVDKKFVVTRTSTCPSDSTDGQNLVWGVVPLLTIDWDV